MAKGTEQPRALIRWLMLLLLVAAAVPSVRAACAAAPTAAASTAAPPVSVDDLQRLVDTLQDAPERAKLVGQLRALIAAQRKLPAEKPVGAALLGRLSQQIDALTGEVLAGAAMVVDAPRLVGWARAQVVYASARQRWIDAAFGFAVVFGSAAAAECVLRWLLARVRPRMPTRQRDSTAVWVSFALLALVLDLIPLGVFAAFAYAAVATALTPFTPTRITLSVLVTATVEARLILCLARALLQPADPAAPLLPIDAETRSYLYIWIMRFTVWGVYGYAVPEAAWWLGIPGPLYALLLKLVGLVLALLAVIFLLQNRRAVAGWIAGNGSSGSGWGRIRRALAEIWALLAIFYIIGIYAIYALHIEGGFVYVLRATVLSVVIIAVARVLVHSIRSASRGGFAVAPALKAQFPTLEHRANRYLPILTGTISAVIFVTAGLSVLQAWDVRSFAWLDTELARRFGEQLMTIVHVLLAALAAWEIFAAATERYLGRIDESQPPRRTRVRTMLPLLRTAMLIVLAVLGGLIILSHLGIDIAPLLAGAGVIGVAVGFGSQALVKDVITGLFILAEDQLAVGDIVDVGKDHRGVVEAITVRTIRLRDQAGTVHTVPFSEVTTVKNMAREFAYAVSRITIAYGEDVDRVVEILRETASQLQEDEALRPLILDPFEFQGVDALDEFSVVLLVRIRTLPSKQFTVGRAFNRLVKIAFDRHGIASRDPTPMLLLTPPATAADEARAEPPSAQLRRA